MSISSLLAIGMGRSPSRPYVDRKRLRIIQDLRQSMEDDMPARKPKTKAGKKEAVRETMHEFKHGTLHSGSKKGPKVKKRKQAVAIALHQSGQSRKK